MLEAMWQEDLKSSSRRAILPHRFWYLGHQAGLRNKFGKLIVNAVAEIVFA